jgi:hypothetical protein
MKVLTSSKDLCNIPVKALLNFHHIFSDGLSSGEYGGMKSNAMFSGITRVFALWKAPLSKSIILNSSTFSLENSSRNT